MLTALVDMTLILARTAHSALGLLNVIASSAYLLTCGNQTLINRLGGGIITSTTHLLANIKSCSVL